MCKVGGVIFFYIGLFCICFRTLSKKSSNPKVCELHASKWTHLMSVVMQSIYRKAFQGRSVNSADVQIQGQGARGKNVVQISRYQWLAALVDLLITSSFCCYHFLEDLVSEQEI